MDYAGLELKNEEEMNEMKVSREKVGERDSVLVDGGENKRKRKSQV